MDPRADRPRPLGLSLAHWRSTLGTALLRLLQGSRYFDNCQSGMDGRSEDGNCRRSCGFFGWHSASTENDDAALSHTWLGDRYLLWRFRCCKGDGGPCGRPQPQRSHRHGISEVGLISEREKPEEAIRSFERANRLSPVDPLLFARLTGMGVALIGLGRFDEALAAARRSLGEKKTAQGYRCLAAALAHLGRDAEAKKAAAKLLEMEPDFLIAEWVARGGHWRSGALIDGLRRAGLPE